MVGCRAIPKITAGWMPTTTINENLSDYPTSRDILTPMKLTTKLSLALVICLGIVLGVAYAQTKAPAAQAPQASAQSQAGRYQIVTSPVLARNTFLLDTQTGRIWQLTQFTNLKDEPTAWMIQPRLDNDAEESKWVITQGFK